MTIDLEAIRKRDAISAETWFKAPNTGPARAFQDRRALLQELDRITPDPAVRATSLEILQSDGTEFDPAIARQVIENVRRDYASYKALRDRADVRSHCSDQLHEDVGFLLWVCQHLLDREREASEMVSLASRGDT